MTVPIKKCGEIDEIEKGFDTSPKKEEYLFKGDERKQDFILNVCTGITGFDSFLLHTFCGSLDGIYGF